MRRAPWLACTLLLLPACTSHGNTTPSPDAQPLTDGGLAHPCTLPGSIVFTATGHTTVSGGSTTWPDLTFLHLPAGFCAHYFATVGNARQIRFAPGGELFVASPSALTTGGGTNGIGAIAVLPDANGDGVADRTAVFLGDLPSTQGLLFANGSLYYQDGTSILQVPYKAGDLTPSGAGVQVADFTYYSSALHWPKTLDIADDGTIYVGNGGDQDELCVQPHPFRGGIRQLDPGDPNGLPVAQGLRNAIAVRCARGHDLCFATELALDYSSGQGGREKLIPIRKGDDWGFPCCATRDLPYAKVYVNNDPGDTPDCSGVTAESNAFLIGDTPFGVDFEGGKWPAPWTGDAFVVTHGGFGTWAGARMVAIPMDPTTGLPRTSTDTDGGDVGMTDFATGWTIDQIENGRPAAVTFAPDGRLFVANDWSGVIFWIAPVM